MSFVQPVSAVIWTSANGCWTATNGNQNLIMWNVSGVNSWTVPSGLTNLSVLVVTVVVEVEVLHPLRRMLQAAVVPERLLT